MIQQVHDAADRNGPNYKPLNHMPRYYFDLRSGGASSFDEEGVDLLHVEAAHDLAVSAIADAVRDSVLEGAVGQNFTLQVRDEIGPVLEVTAVYGSKMIRTQ
jgi:hypothetical protein